MRFWVCAMVVAVCVGALGSPSLCGAADVRLTCLLPAETREVLQTHQYIRPFRALIEAARGGTGEPIAIRLCRSTGTLMVYDVTLLRHDGHLVQIEVDAGDGALIVPRAGK